MQDQIDKLPKFKKIAIAYTLFVDTARRCDIANICCVVDKYFCDALTESGKLDDDNYNYLPIIHYQFGGQTDKAMVLIEIKEIK